ncbi:MAG: four-carbon acid sugar kinase family protein [Aestuariivirga sp.]
MKRLVSYYGDDFTGSTDVMESLAVHGVETVLFTRLPSTDEFARFASFKAFGLAGTSRSQTPEWMDEHLPQAFDWLKSLEARFCHYKVCSTFDSSPAIGNIGRAIEIGARIFAQKTVPLIVGAPQLKRFTFAGNLFAGYQGETYRIDRHPVMSRHPVTPMSEADLRLHLARQTTLDTCLANSEWPANGIGLIDVFDAQSQLRAGQRLLKLPAPAFLAGSSGIEYALMNAMTQSGDVPGKAEFASLEKAGQIAVVSGSVSPTTERQIRFALSHGFEAVPVSPLELARGDMRAVSNAIEAALAVLSRGASPLVYTALGGATDEGSRIDSVPNGRRAIGEGLGRTLRAILERTTLRRVIIAGGDSSSHALGQLDIFALVTRFPLAATPGSPLCTAYSSHARLDQLDIAMKGGQLGGDGYFVQLRDGRE